MPALGKRVRGKKTSTQRSSNVSLSLGSISSISTRRDNHSFNISCVDEPEDVFLTMLKSAGYTFKTNGDVVNVLRIEPPIFPVELMKVLRSQEHHDEKLEEFLVAMKTFLNDNDNFTLCLKPAKLELEFASLCRPVCIIRMLLGIDEVQAELRGILLDKLHEASCTEKTGEELIRLPKMILNQLKRLINIVESEVLTEKILDILEATPSEIQCEIISALPDILDESDHEKAALKLSDMLSDMKMVPVILDAFQSFHLKSDIISTLQHSVLKTITSIPLSDMPSVVKFIIESVEKDTAVSVISELRHWLDFTPCILEHSTPKKRRMNYSDQTSMENMSGEILTLDAIRVSMKMRSYLGDAWLKSIECVGDVDELKTIDILLLVVMTEDKYLQKNAFRVMKHKIKTGMFTEDLIKKAFKVHTESLKKYFNPLNKLAEDLLKSPEAVVAQFGGHMFMLSFRNFDGVHRHHIIMEMVNLVGLREPIVVEMALKLLKDMVVAGVELKTNLSVLPLCLVDFAFGMDLKQVRLVYDIVSTVAYGVPDTNIQSSLIINVKKYLSQTPIKSKRMGVIAAIQILKNMSVDPHNNIPSSLSSENSEGSIVQLPSAMKEIFDQIQSCTSASPEAEALFLDELANVTVKKELQDFVQKYVASKMREDFQEHFIIDDDSVEEVDMDKESGVVLSPQYNRNDVYNDTGIGLMIPILVHDYRNSRNISKIHPEDPKKSILAMNSLFRALWVCESSQKGGDLTDINALLGCHIHLPKPQLIEEFEDLSNEERDLICNSLIFTANWFRELISAFANQKDAEVKEKVHHRLRDLLTVQNQLLQCVPYATEFIPPLANFYDDSIVPASLISNYKIKTGRSKGKGARSKGKGKKSKPDAQAGTGKSPTSQNGDNGTEDGITTGSKKGSVSLAQLKPYLRELDVHVTVLLADPLELYDESDHSKLSPAALQFLLEDYKSKVEHSLISSVSRNPFFADRKNKAAGFTHLDLYSESDIMLKSLKLLKYLKVHLTTLGEYFQKVNDFDSSQRIRRSYDEVSVHENFNLLFQCLNTLFSWKGFKSAEYKEQLKFALKTFCEDSDSISTKSSIARLSTSACQLIEKWRNSINHIECAMYHLKLLDAVAGFQPCPENSLLLVTCSEDYLHRAWDDVDQKAVYVKQSVEHFLHVHFNNGKDKLQVLSDWCKDVADAMENDGKKFSLESYPTFNKNTFPAFFRTMFHMLITCVKEISNLKNTEDKELLQKWSLCVHILYDLIKMLKIMPARNNLTVCMKFSRAFMEQYADKAMALLFKMFLRYQQSITSQLKTLQQSTRYFQAVCSHSKKEKDMVLTKHVPFMKKALETVISKVGHMLAVNNCAEAFWLGNLKNRDLQGEEILSQMPTHDEDDEEGDEDIDTALDANEDDDSDNSDGSRSAIV